MADGGEDGPFNSQEVVVVMEALPARHNLAQTVAAVVCVTAVVALFS